MSKINDWPVGDDLGMGVAVQMMEKYLPKRGNERDSLKFNTVHQLRESVSDVYYILYMPHASRYSL